MILKIAAGLIVVLGAILLFAGTRPNTFYVQRSIWIAAPGEKVFSLINDFHRWPQWGPQDRSDSTMKRTYSGSSSGLGAASEWSGKGSTGSGRMWITESVPSSRVSVRTDFVKPFKAHNLNEFTVQPEGRGTRLNWSMKGSNLFPMKVMSMFMNMDREMGKHFEAGLANLKVVVEGE